MADVKFRFYLSTLRPDQRQYRQQEMELFCSDYDGGLESIPVEVVLPLEHKLIANAEDIIQVRLGSVNGDPEEPKPVLTIAGLKYLQDRFDDVFLAQPEQKKTEDDWGADFDEETPKKEETKSSDDEWESEGKPAADKTTWDESTDEWES